MHIEMKTNGYPLSRLDRDRIDAAIERIDRLTDTYPTRRIHVTIERVGHGEECHVRMLLAAARHRFVATDRAPSVAPAIQRCVDILAEEVQHRKNRVSRNHGERHVRRAKEEAGIFDPERLRAAYGRGDYEAFKDALGEVPDMIEAEVGRRIKFHPDAEALLGRELTFDDIVEAVIFDAFEGFLGRPENVSFREWILAKIDPCIDETARGARPTDLAA